MSIQSVGIRAYANALQNFAKTERVAKGAEAGGAGASKNEFSSVLTDSLAKVNDLQKAKSQMITSFASGEQQNVHELMISLQKASVAMQLTSAVRNKVLEAYRELSKLQF